MSMPIVTTIFGVIGLRTVAALLRHAYKSGYRNGYSDGIAHAGKMWPPNHVDAPGTEAKPL